MNQAKLEKEMRESGIERARAMIERNEEKGRAETNPYAQALYRRYLLPLAEAIRTAAAGSGKPGRRKAHVSLIEGLDGAVAASITVREVLNKLLAQESHTDAKSIARNIGVTVQREMALQVMNVEQPELLWDVQHDLDRRHSKNARHRFNAVAGAARNAGIEMLSWGPVERETLGLFLLEELRNTGMIEIEPHTETKFKKVNTVFIAYLSADARMLIGNIKEAVELSLPYALPFIEQPKDWIAFNDGGYHTMEMRTSAPYCLQYRRADRQTVSMYKEYPTYTAKMRSGLNALQSVRWAINGDMLDLIEDISQRIDTDEILMQAEVPKPPRPHWLTEGMTKDTMNPEQLTEFTQWKRELAEWYTECKLRFTKWGRFGTAMRVARKFREFPAIHFMYQADFRGRVYAITTGVSPQGSDLQKALIHFADGKPLDTPQAVAWFKRNIANKFGIDKVPHAEQEKWVDENSDLLVAIGTEPVRRREWMDADCPLQFIAACREYARFVNDPAGFVSHLPIGLDGSCNGLQHFSAMLRDAVGGRATNLLDGERPNDIYAQVAEVVERLLRAELEKAKPEPATGEEAKRQARESEYLNLWLAHGVNRSLVKRSVMTLPYGSTRFSCADFIVADYLRMGKAPEFKREQYSYAASYLSHFAWAAIGQVVIAAREAMDYLQKSAQVLIKSPLQQIEWFTPTGFKVRQVYREADIVTINSILLGGVRIRVGATSDRADINGHKNGLPPNFVHSMDAAHMCLTTIAAKAEGIESLAMIHDDYGTHAADTERLYNIIREQFVSMYEQNDPLELFKEMYSELLAETPRKGDLDLREVLRSKFFFT